MSQAIARLYSFLSDYNAGLPIDDRKVDAELDQLLAAINQNVQIKSSAPATPVDGQTWVDIGLNPPVMKVYDLTNTAWLSQALGVLTTRGDILYRGASGLLRLPKGTDGHFLKIGANDPEWAAAGGNFKVIRTTRDMTAVSGDVAYTGAGFTPKAVIGIASNKSLAIGIATGAVVTTDMLAIFEYEDQAAMGNNNAFLELYDGAGVNQSSELKTLDADGCTLTWTKNGSPGADTAQIGLLFIG